MKFSLLVLLTCLSFLGFTQEKVDWSFSFDNRTSEIHVHAEIEKGWHLYSLNLANDLGPIPTEIVFNENKSVQFSENTSEPTPIVSYDENFGGDLSYFENEVTFKNKINATENTTVSGYVVFMVCNNEMCLPPTEVEFKINI